MKKITIIMMILIAYLSSCTKCTNTGSVNIGSEDNKGKCIYSGYVLYVSSSLYSGKSILPLKVYFDNQYVGTLYDTALIAPLNCSSALPVSAFITGTLPDNGVHSWTAIDSANTSATFNGNLTSDGELCEVIKIN